MEEYRSNSRKSKETASREGDENKRVVKKVTTNTVKTKKKSGFHKFTDTFISEDMENVSNYILMDVLVPAVKKAISDIVVNGIDMVLYGETNHSKKSSSGTKVSYRSYYDSDRRDRERGSAARRSSYTYDDIVLDNRGDAEDVLDSMLEIVDKYGTVSVADMYDLVGMTGHYTDNKYGWTDLRNARVERDRDGGYYIKLPRVLPI